MGEPAEPRLLRAWSTMSFEGTPDEVAEDAVNRARPWRAVGRGEDARFRVVFGATYSDADMAAIGAKAELLPVPTELADRFGDAGRFYVDARTEADARWLDEFHGEGCPGGRVFARVEHDPGGDWRLDGQEKEGDKEEVRG